jgi:hypothetical protein
LNIWTDGSEENCIASNTDRSHQDEWEKSRLVAVGEVSADSVDDGPPDVDGDYKVLRLAHISFMTMRKVIERTCLVENLKPFRIMIGKNVPKPYKIVTTAICMIPCIQLLTSLAASLMSALL